MTDTINPVKSIRRLKLLKGAETFTRSVTLPVTAAAAFAWHERPGALEALTPPWESVRVLSVTDGIREGSRVTLKARAAFVWTTWVMEHHGYVPGCEFNDRMLRGPFPHWEHRHLFTNNGDGTCVMEDTIRYVLPLGILGRLFGGAFTRKKLARLFAYRHAATQTALAL